MEHCNGLSASCSSKFAIDTKVYIVFQTIVEAGKLQHLLALRYLIYLHLEEINVRDYIRSNDLLILCMFDELTVLLMTSLLLVVTKAGSCPRLVPPNCICQLSLYGVTDIRGMGCARAEPQPPRGNFSHSFYIEI